MKIEMNFTVGLKMTIFKNNKVFSLKSLNICDCQMQKRAQVSL